MMHSLFKYPLLFAGLTVLLLLVATDVTSAAVSQWVYPGPDGKLVYKTTPAGDKIMDFSTAGYLGGGVALPDVPVKRTVQPTGRPDDTRAIQSAIAAVAALPLQDGFRGAVLLAPGTFTCSNTIYLPASGVVLRGSGMDAKKGGTTIKMVGRRHNAITIGAEHNHGFDNGSGPTVGDDDPAPGRTRSINPELTAARTTITDAYVPSGADTFTVASASGFAVGDAIAIRRPTTEAWVHLMQMDTLTRNGRPQTWIGTSRGNLTTRTITAINGNRLTIDIPLADSYDARYLNPPGTTVGKVKPADILNHIGIEGLHIQCPPLEIAYGQAPYSAIRVNGEDCWVKDVYCEETMNATALRGRRITMDHVVVYHTYPNLGASKPTDFSIEGSQILINRCHISGDNMYFVWTTSLNPGPNVILNSSFTGRGSHLQPHMRWSTGLLVDNCKVPDGGIDFMNRGAMGSGHGWTMGWAVAWNCLAKTYAIQSPPGALNWAIGCIGHPAPMARPFDASPILPEGVFDSLDSPVAPQSLYLAQLAERLGPQAIKNIGYGSNTRQIFADSTLPQTADSFADVDPELGPNLALHRPVNASNVRNHDRQFGGEKAVDGAGHAYWSVDDDALPASLELDMEGPVDINALELREPAALQGHVLAYKVEGQVNSDWKLLSQGTTIGDRKIDRFPQTTVWKVRLTILKSQSYPAVSKFGLYLGKTLISAAQ